MKWRNDELNSVPDSCIQIYLYPSTNLSNTTVSVISSTVDIHASMYNHQRSTIQALFKTMLYFGHGGATPKHMGLTLILPYNLEIAVCNLEQFII